MKYLSLIMVALCLFATACGATNQNTKEEGHFEPPEGTEVYQPKEECFNGSLSREEVVNLIRGIPVPCVPDQKLTFDVHCEMWWHSQVSGGGISAYVDYKRETPLRHAVTSWLKMRGWAAADAEEGTFITAYCSDAARVMPGPQAVNLDDILQEARELMGNPPDPIPTPEPTK